MLLSLNFSTGANGACDPGRYFGYWTSDALDIQLSTVCGFNVYLDREITFPGARIWSSLDGNPYQVAYSHASGVVQSLDVKFDSAHVRIHRPEDNNQDQLLVERFDPEYNALVIRDNKDVPRETFLLKLTFLAPSKRPEGICQFSPFDGQWADGELFNHVQKSGFEIQISTSCDTSGSGVDDAEIQVLVAEDRIPLRVKSVSDNGDHLAVELVNGSVVFVHIPNGDQIIVDRLKSGESEWQRFHLSNQHQLPQ